MLALMDRDFNLKPYRQKAEKKNEAQAESYPLHFFKLSALETILNFDMRLGTNNRSRENAESE